MSKDPTIAVRDCLTEIEILHDIAARMTLEMGAARDDRLFHDNRSNPALVITQ
jgi:hypothetical protein